MPPYWSYRPMRTGWILKASPDGAFATAWTVMPSSLAPFCNTGSAADDAGTQIVPVPKSWPSAVSADFSQYTSALFFSRRFTSMKELLMWWLIRYPAGFAAPVIEPGSGCCMPFSWTKGPSKPSRIAIVLDAHLHRERPSGDIVRRHGRAAWIRLRRADGPAARTFRGPWGGRPDWS